MKLSETWIYGILLAVTLGFAHAAWQDEDAGQGGGGASDIVVFDPGKAGVSRIHWDSKKNVTTIEIEGRGDAGKPWITAGKRPKLEGPAAPPTDIPIGETTPAASASASAAAAATGSPEAKGVESPVPVNIEAPEPTPVEPIYGEPELRSFPGGKQATELVERFAPLRALRRFDGLDEESLADMGLDDPEARLVVSAGNRSLELEVGKKAYGSSDTYTREPQTGVVYLLGSKTLGALRTGSTRLMERNLFDFEPVDASEATVQQAQGSRSRSFRHEGRHDEANAYWADPDNLEEIDTAADGFLKKVFQLRATTYATETDRPDNAALDRLFRVRFDGTDERQVALARLLNEERSKDDEPVYDFYAQSAITRDQWVKVSRTTGSDLADALDALLGG